MKIYSRGERTLQNKFIINPHKVDLYDTDTGCMILIGKEGEPKKRWHLSISHPERYPTWDEIKQARYDLLPRDRDFCMVLPKTGDMYVNIHENCFHLWQVLEGELYEAIDRF